ncbi:SDR family oxidoreductase [Aestuariibius sp. HNIBRBA575]|uniref:SDR family oxidoreductase n=1 Tax=Aestuariibius sp. HNIBRBA575 TaxID=3233343 RepID=UPI0034A14C61
MSSIDKTFVVTGASTGLGLAIAVQAAKAGFRTFATMRNPAKADKLNAALSDAGVSADIVQLDVQDDASVENAIAQIIEKTGKIDVLVNNAGSGFVRNIEQTDIKTIQDVMDVNFTGVVRTTRAALPHMRAARAGHVINISSVGGLVGQPFNEIYCAAKFAVEGFTESLATYVGSTFGLHFTTVQPGGIRSEFADRALKQVMDTGGMLDDEYLPVLQAYVSGAQSRAEEAGLYQTVDEVAEVVLNCALSDTPPIRLRTSDWGEKFCALKTQADPDGHLQNQAVINRFLTTPDA